MAIILGILLLTQPITAPLPLAKDRAEEIARRIWKNECGGTIEGLTSWNDGEEFASLGIGHFIWYPKEKRGPFQEQFPEYLAFAEKSGSYVPKWLKEQEGCPWQTREEFLRDFDSPRMHELRYFLHATLAVQTRFICKKLETILPELVKELSKEQKQHVVKMFYKVAGESNGIYILLDYLNFKGSGLFASERYAGKGWGLLQVLLQMSDTSFLAPSHEFVMAAKQVLSDRVKNAPQERNEGRFLKGWYYRLDSYLH